MQICAEKKKKVH